MALALVSRAPLERIRPFHQRMGWDLPWVSSRGSSFNADMGVSVAESAAAFGEARHNYRPTSAPAGSEFGGLSVFARDDAGDLFHTYSTFERGLEVFMGTYRVLDVVPAGRDEDGLDYGMQWLRHRDRY